MYVLDIEKKTKFTANVAFFLYKNVSVNQDSNWSIYLENSTYYCGPLVSLSSSLWSANPEFTRISATSWPYDVKKKKRFLVELAFFSLYPIEIAVIVLTHEELHLSDPLTVGI